jgi:hypothetical protein
MTGVRLDLISLQGYGLQKRVQIQGCTGHASRIYERRRNASQLQPSEPVPRARGLSEMLQGLHAF